MNDNLRDWSWESVSWFPGSSPKVTSAGKAGVCGHQTWLGRQVGKVPDLTGEAGGEGLRLDWGGRWGGY